MQRWKGSELRLHTILTDCEILIPLTINLWHDSQGTDQVAIAKSLIGSGPVGVFAKYFQNNCVCIY